MPAIPIVLDCDPGHDDAFAIWLAAGHPGIDLRAVTTVGGNGDLTHTTHNARVVCTVAGVLDVPIAAGADAPLVRDLRTAAHIHGKTALDGPVSPEPSVPLDPRGALGLLRSVITESAEPVTVVATGPLTNIALLARVHPEVFARVARIVWMGGSTARGNVTPHAEFNAFVDPEAAAVVLGLGVPVAMIGLNVTHQALVTDEVQRRLAGIGNRTSAFGNELLTFYRSAYRVSEGMPDAPLHDPIAVALVAAPEVVTGVATRVDVELHGTQTAGATSVDLRGTGGRLSNAWVGLDLDADRFWDLLVTSLAALS
jgi:purine nucleosidase/pyrimidine-specific ribonucleoside hydrolase